MVQTLDTCVRVVMDMRMDTGDLRVSENILEHVVDCDFRELSTTARTHN